MSTLELSVATVNHYYREDSKSRQSTKHHALIQRNLWWNLVEMVFPGFQIDTESNTVLLELCKRKWNAKLLQEITSQASNSESLHKKSIEEEAAFHWEMTLQNHCKLSWHMFSQPSILLKGDFAHLRE